MPQSPFRTPQTLNPDASAPLPEIQSFPIGVSENAEASVQVFNSFFNVLGQDHLTYATSNASIEIMIYRLLEAHQMKSEEVYRQQFGRRAEAYVVNGNRTGKDGKDSSYF